MEEIRSLQAKEDAENDVKEKQSRTEQLQWLKEVHEHRYFDYEGPEKKSKHIFFKILITASSSSGDSRASLRPLSFYLVSVKQCQCFHDPRFRENNPIQSVLGRN